MRSFTSNEGQYLIWWSPWRASACPFAWRSRLHASASASPRGLSPSKVQNYTKTKQYSNPWNYYSGCHVSLVVLNALSCTLSLVLLSRKSWTRKSLALWAEIFLYPEPCVIGPGILSLNIFFALKYSFTSTLALLSLNISFLPEPSAFMLLSLNIHILRLALMIFNIFVPWAWLCGGGTPRQGAWRCGGCPWWTERRRWAASGRTTSSTQRPKN